MIGAILTGGGSRRMGGRPKADLRLPDGRTMVDVVAAVLRPVTERLVIVGETGMLADAERLHDRRTHAGPLAGLETLVMSGLGDDYLVCPCDMPRLGRALLERLAVPSEAMATVLQVPGEERPRSMPLRMAAAIAPVVSSALDADRRAVHALLAEIKLEIVETPADWIPELENVNTDEAYLSYLSSSRSTAS